MGVDTLTDLLDRHDLVGVRAWLDEQPAYVIADELARMDAVSAMVPFRMLGKDQALEVFEELDPTDQQQLLSGLRDRTFHELVEGMDPDDRARMLGEAPAKVTTRVLSGLSTAERKMTASLLGYPDGSVGRMMSPRIVSLPISLTVSQALQRIRDRGADAETIDSLPILESGRRLVAMVGLRDLVTADPHTPLATLVDWDVPHAAATDTAEDAARLMTETNVPNLPVVDSEDRLVGLFTFDDAMEAIETADTEDFARQAASTPWSGHYMFASVWQLARSRATWLLLLLVAATLTVAVTQAFEATLEEVTALALFIPLLIGTGGNAGAQSATAAVRALAVGEVRPSDLMKVIWRECRVGLLLGTMLAILGMTVAAIAVDPTIAVVVAISLVVICAWAATVGGTMPILAKQANIDPAVVSAPMVTTLVDATGLIIYFGTANLILNL